MNHIMGHINIWSNRVESFTFRKTRWITTPSLTCPISDKHVVLGRDRPFLLLSVFILVDFYFVVVLCEQMNLLLFLGFAVCKFAVVSRFDCWDFRFVVMFWFWRVVIVSAVVFPRLLVRCWFCCFCHVFDFAVVSSGLLVVQFCYCASWVLLCYFQIDVVFMVLLLFPSLLFPNLLVVLIFL